MKLHDLLKLLSDHNRLRILAVLGEGTYCVCDLEAGLGINQSNLSRHLGKLRSAGLVRATKKGMFVYYQRLVVDDPVLLPVLQGLFRALDADPVLNDDRLRLVAWLEKKPGNLCS